MTVCRLGILPQQVAVLVADGQTFQDRAIFVVFAQGKPNAPDRQKDEGKEPPKHFGSQNRVEWQAQEGEGRHDEDGEPFVGQGPIGP